MSYLAHLYSHLRIHQVFGANTDVGKTIFTTALALASASLPLANSLEVAQVARDQDGFPIAHDEGEKVQYIKPVSTGALQDADSLHISRYAPFVNATTLFQYDKPVSPHLAAALHGSQIPSDDQLILRLSDTLLGFSKMNSHPSAAYVETAGGVHSPSPSGSSMASALRPLRLPTILIGDSNLGGISTTRSAYDSLILAGYDVQALLLFSDSSRGLGNAEYLSKWGAEVGLAVWSLAGPNGDYNWGRPPQRNGSKQEDELRMRKFYSGLVYGRQNQACADEHPNGVLSVVQHLRNIHTSRLRDLDSMGSRTLESCWWPFTQHASVTSPSDVNVIDSAHGDFFSIFSSAQKDNATILKSTLDGSASWWTQCLGHASTPLVYAATRAAARYGHVLFPMCSNEPALRLSEMLLGRDRKYDSSNTNDQYFTRIEASPAPGQGWASRVFFSDDGSTGMEVGIKMAISSTAARYAPSAKTQSTKDRISPGRQPGYMGGRPSREWKVLGLKGSYHGDTIGAMDACEGNVFNEKVHWYRGRGDWLEPPKVGIKDGKVIVELPMHDADWCLLQVDQSSFDFTSLDIVYDVESRVSTDPLHKLYTTFIYDWLDRLTRLHGNRYGALILEPLVMGAGGMIFIDPLFQRCFVDVIRQNAALFNQTDPPLDRKPPLQPALTQKRAASEDWQGLPIIFDEVFTGLYRLGYSTPAIPLGVKPDISCLAKILTGGMVPMSVTLASKSIFETFSQSDQKADALLHGHSYTAHPIGCEVARETLSQIEKMSRNGLWAEEQAGWARTISPGSQAEKDTSSHPWSFWDINTVMTLSKMDRVDKVMSLGTVLVVELKDMTGSGGYSSTASVDLLHKLRNAPDGPFAIHVRPLGNVVYFMCSLNTPKDVRTKTEQALMAALQ